MTDEQIALAHRVVACRGWESMGGMLHSDVAWRPRVGEGWSWRAGAEVLPQLDDPATLRCLLALVREVRQEPTGFVVPTHAGGWSYYTRLIAADWYSGDTEAEALVAALESAS